MPQERETPVQKLKRTQSGAMTCLRGIVSAVEERATPAPPEKESAQSDDTELPRDALPSYG